MATEWEYTTVELPTKTEPAAWNETLRRLGAEGWMLQTSIPLIDIDWSIYPVTKAVRMVFMRPKPQP